MNLTILSPKIMIPFNHLLLSYPLHPMIHFNLQISIKTFYKPFLSLIKIPSLKNHMMIPSFHYSPMIILFHLKNKMFFQFLCPPHSMNPYSLMIPLHPRSRTILPSYPKILFHLMIKLIHLLHLTILFLVKIKVSHHPHVKSLSHLFKLSMNPTPINWDPPPLSTPVYFQHLSFHPYHILPKMDLHLVSQTIHIPLVNKCVKV